jgi:hypothetical protein
MEIEERRKLGTNLRKAAAEEVYHIDMELSGLMAIWPQHVCVGNKGLREWGTHSILGTHFPLCAAAATTSFRPDLPSKSEFGHNLRPLRPLFCVQCQNPHNCLPDWNGWGMLWRQRHTLRHSRESGVHLETKFIWAFDGSRGHGQLSSSFASSSHVLKALIHPSNWGQIKFCKIPSNSAANPL